MAPAALAALAVEAARAAEAALAAAARALAAEAVEAARALVEVALVEVALVALDLAQPERCIGPLVSSKMEHWSCCEGNAEETPTATVPEAKKQDETSISPLIRNARQH